MGISIMLSLLVISTEGHNVVVKLNELQGWELIDKGLQKNGGIIELYLKDRKDSIVIAIHKEEDWSSVCSWFNNSILSLSSEMNKTNVDESWKYEAKF